MSVAPGRNENNWRDILWHVVSCRLEDSQILCVPNGSIQAEHEDIVREVIEFIRASERHHKKTMVTPSGQVGQVVWKLEAERERERFFWYKSIQKGCSSLWEG